MKICVHNIPNGHSHPALKVIRCALHHDQAETMRSSSPGSLKQKLMCELHPEMELLHRRERGAILRLLVRDQMYAYHVICVQ
jgi:hypothetical protein